MLRSLKDDGFEEVALIVETGNPLEALRLDGQLGFVKGAELWFVSKPVL